jgi:nicotinamide-nucleotide amidase
MRASIIAIGDEILIGQVLNSNAAYLSTKLHSIGIPVHRMATVPDSEAAILHEFRYSFSRYDVIIATGGLGPTHDDITTKCIAKFFRSGLILNKAALGRIKELFRRRKIPMPEINIQQAMVPKISKALPNKVGTAPGILIEKNKKIFCALPGVPAEMKSISENSLIPYLTARLKRAGKKLSIIKFKTLHTIGIAESKLFEKIGDISKIEMKSRGCEIKIAFLPANFEVRIRISAYSDDPRRADEGIASAVSKLRRKAGDFIYSYDESPIEKVVGDILKKRKLKVSVAESCTGGLIASKITDVSGSSGYFPEGITAYSNKSKIKLLGIKENAMKKYGAVSKHTAIAMAEGIRRRSGADIGLSTTGIAGPTGAVRKKPVGIVWIGYADKECSFAKEFYFTKDRLRNKEIMSKMALELLRRKLLGMQI